MAHCFWMDVSDLNPESLARLEAKLTAELDMVRKVRALLSDHFSGTASPAAPSALSPAPAPLPIIFTPGPPPPDVKVVVGEIIAEIGGEFRMGDVKDRLWKRKIEFPDSSIRSVIMRMAQYGQVLVVKREKGRRGSLYAPIAEAKPPPAAPEPLAEETTPAS